MFTKLALSAFTAAGALVLAGCATQQPISDEEIAEAIPDYARTGETQSCVSLTRLDHIRPVTDELWLFEMRNGDMYLNQVSRGCNQAASSFTYLQYETAGSQLCRNEIVRVVQQTTDINAGSCGLNDFERLTPVE